jgi:hypothetical protein
LKMKFLVLALLVGSAFAVPAGTGGGGNLGSAGDNASGGGGGNGLGGGFDGSTSGGESSDYSIGNCLGICSYTCLVGLYGQQDAWSNGGLLTIEWGRIFSAQGCDAAEAYAKLVKENPQAALQQAIQGGAKLPGGTSSGRNRFPTFNYVSAPSPLKSGGPPPVSGGSTSGRFNRFSRFSRWGRGGR